MHIKFASLKQEDIENFIQHLQESFAVAVHAAYGVKRQH